MNKLFIVSNRLPINVVKRGTSLRFLPSVGGLATGLTSLKYESYEMQWIGWPGIALEKITPNEKNKIINHLDNHNCFPVFLTQPNIDNYYSGFCNKTIWPLFHYFTQYATYSKNQWNAYCHINRLFCDTILEKVKPGDSVWIHDYHLLLLPMMLREKIPDITIGFFLHIPFPSFEVFRLMPWRREILEGLLGADLIGFHTYDYVRHFLSSIRNMLGYEHSLGRILMGNRIVKVDTFPMGIDYDRYSNAVNDHEVQQEIEKNRNIMGNRTIILSIDRLDYTKGIVQRLRLFDLFLDKYPKYKEKVALILVVVPSRVKVEQYRGLKRELDELVGRINGKHGMMDWIPIRYFYQFLTFKKLVAFYKLSDIGLITPLRDGMNLIAKEFIATKTDGKGVLILSEMAGASKELGEAIIVNPNNIEKVADSIKKALTMPVEEQIERNRIMQRRLKRYNVKKWAEDFLKNLASMKEHTRGLFLKKLSPELRKELKEKYRKSTHRLILLDYDGTITPFAPKPHLAKPDTEVLLLLDKLSQDKLNEVVIISGRDKATLDEWFKDLNIGIVAEHGAWIKEKGGAWELIEPLVNYWKDEIRPLIERCMDRTPGSFIEEKEYSLVWHYRNSDSALASIRARELKEAILSLSTNVGLGILEGSKVVEIKSVGINKGRAAQKWIAENTFGFILAAGDDMTDEEIFNVLPEDACSIKVGLPPYSKAKYTISSVEEFRLFIKEMVED